MIEIIENTKEARDNSTAGGQGHEEDKITMQNILDLMSGKAMMIDINAEYSLCLTLQGIKVPESHNGYLAEEEQ